MGKGKEFIDLTVGMAIHDSGENVGQGSDDGPMFGAAVGTCKQRVFPIERDRTDGAFGGVVVELDEAIIDEARQALPARESIASASSPFCLVGASFICSHCSNVSASSRLVCCR